MREGAEPRAPAPLPCRSAVTHRQTAQDLRHHYVLGYSSENKARDGSYRSIRVTARSSGHSKLLVRTREGYFASEMQGRL